MVMHLSVGVTTLVDLLEAARSEALDGRCARRLRREADDDTERPADAAARRPAADGIGRDVGKPAPWGRG